MSDSRGLCQSGFHIPLPPLPSVNRVGMAERVVRFARLNELMEHQVAQLPIEGYGGDIDDDDDDDDDGDEEEEEEDEQGEQ